VCQTFLISDSIYILGPFFWETESVIAKTNFALGPIEQARKLQATLVQSETMTHSLTDLPTGVRCRATSVAKNCYILSCYNGLLFP